MVYLGYVSLVLDLAAHLVWAARPHRSDSQSVLDADLQGRDQYVLSWCPPETQKCSECGGDSKHTGWCDERHIQESSNPLDQCMESWGMLCGHICPCTNDETGEVGVDFPLVYWFPAPPPGFVPPPAGLQNPQEQCPKDYTTTSCRDCEPLEGWCSKGERVGCPCREECPADDSEDKPSCSAEDCKGENGSCTIGHYKDCKCSDVQCPDPEKEILVCSDDICNGEDESKCTSDEYNGCKCYHLITPVAISHTAAEIDSDSKILNQLIEDMEAFYNKEEEASKPEVTCATKDYSKAIEVDSSFLDKLADKFCSDNDDGKERSKDLTAKDVSSSAYERYKFHFDYKPGKDCKTDCKAAFKSMTGTCQGIDSHSIQSSAKAEYECGASFSYKVTEPGPKLTQDGWQDRVCHDRDQFGSHGDVAEADLRRLLWFCGSTDGKAAIITADSDPYLVRIRYGSVPYQLKASWIDGCEGPEDSVNVRLPDGNSQHSCSRIFFNNWKKCNNGGAGGYIDYSCVRFDFRPHYD
ncbi:hypothetical protein BDV18DRAFT_165833 [Aspergillus unguis]